MFLMDLMGARHFSPADIGEWSKTWCKTEPEKVAASAVFFPLTSISASFDDSKRAVPGLLTNTYTKWSIKPSTRELM